MKKSRMTSSTGFTLIELLTVIGILGLLAAILFPVMSRAKASGKQSACLSNLHQIGTAVGIYQGDNGGHYPYAVDISDKLDPNNWRAWPEYEAQIPSMPLFNQLMAPYVNSPAVFRCPSDTGLIYLDDSNGYRIDGIPTMYSKYGSSYFYLAEAAFDQYTDSTIPAPANLRLTWDATGGWHGNGPITAAEVEDNDLTKAVEANFHYNAVFADLHTKSINFTQFNTVPWANYSGNYN